MKLADYICTDPDIMSGAVVFRGTRVPVSNLFDYLETGETIERFLSSFPTVTREQVLAVLDCTEQLLCMPEIRFREVVA